MRKSENNNEGTIVIDESEKKFSSIQQQRCTLWSFLHLNVKVLLLLTTVKSEAKRAEEMIIRFYLTFQCMFPAITFESRGPSHKWRARSHLYSRICSL